MIAQFFLCFFVSQTIFISFSYAIDEKNEIELGRNSCKLCTFAYAPLENRNDEALEHLLATNLKKSLVNIFEKKSNKEQVCKFFSGCFIAVPGSWLFFALARDFSQCNLSGSSIISNIYGFFGFTDIVLSNIFFIDSVFDSLLHWNKIHIEGLESGVIGQSVSTLPKLACFSLAILASAPTSYVAYTLSKNQFHYPIWGATSLVKIFSRFYGIEQYIETLKEKILGVIKPSFTTQNFLNQYIADQYRRYKIKYYLNHIRKQVKNASESQLVDFKERIDGLSSPPEILQAILFPSFESMMQIDPPVLSISASEIIKELSYLSLAGLSTWSTSYSNSLNALEKIGFNKSANIILSYSGIGMSSLLFAVGIKDFVNNFHLNCDRRCQNITKSLSACLLISIFATFLTSSQLQLVQDNFQQLTSYNTVPLVNTSNIFSFNSTESCALQLPYPSEKIHILYNSFFSVCVLSTIVSCFTTFYTATTHTLNKACSFLPYNKRQESPLKNNIDEFYKQLSFAVTSKLNSLTISHLYLLTTTSIKNDEPEGIELHENILDSF